MTVALGLQWDAATLAPPSRMFVFALLFHRELQ